MSFARLEQCLLPPPEIFHWNSAPCPPKKEKEFVFEISSSIKKVLHCVKNFFLFITLSLALPFTLLIDLFSKKKVEIVKQEPAEVKPMQVGKSTSTFQTSGLGTKRAAAPPLRGTCDWNEWMEKGNHIIQSIDDEGRPHFYPANSDYSHFFTDILTDPSSYVAMLKKHNVTAHRFSLEWSVIEPEPGQFDLGAVRLYQNFIDALLAVGITPSVTLNHFVVPEWFHKQGGFQKIESVEHYLRFATFSMDTFNNVKDWWSFNELGVKAFQQAREVYPTDLPEGSSLSARVHAAGMSTLHMLVAHCKLHQWVAERNNGQELGVTHQWLQFDTANGNCLERVVAHLFTNFAFNPVYQFFKTGRFAFQIPFMANIQFEIPKEIFEKNGRFLKRLGVQAYPKPMIKMGLNHGHKYAGLPAAIKNVGPFSFGATCEPGNTLMRFGPRWKAEEMDAILDEAFAICPNVYITETGSDAMVWEPNANQFKENDKAQAEYLEKLLARIETYSKTKRRLQGVFIWSDSRRQMEWENGMTCALGLIRTTLNDRRQIVDYTSTEGALVAAAFFERMQTPTPS
jgi:beta-glucosidase/6-phospho-beta-glucosidase/beta-galactosidase